MSSKPVRIELPHAAPLKKTLEALKQFLSPSINFNINNNSFTIEDNAKNIVVNIVFPRLKIKMRNVAESSFSVETCNISDFIKPITAKEKIILEYNAKDSTLGYLCGSKTSFIDVGENSYNATSVSRENRECIAAMREELIEPTCIVDAKTFKDTLKDFKACTGNVNIYSQRSGVKFVSETQRGNYTSTFGRFNDSEMKSNKTYLVASCSGKQLHSIHKIATSAKFVRVFTLRKKLEDDEEIYPLLFEASLDDLGIIQIYIKPHNE